MPDTTAAWLTVVGIGEDGLAGLGEAARTAIAGAEVLVGGRRHLAMVGDDSARRMNWPSPFDALVDELRALRPARVCVLATGDPMHFGVGAVLARSFGTDQLRVLPAPSAFSLACARLGWAAQTTRQLSVHGRPIECIYRWLAPGSRLLILAHDAATPAQVARGLVERGYGATHMTVLERLGGPAERLRDGRAENWSESVVDALHVLALVPVADDREHALSPVPGLPDDAYEHDGQLTKRIVRAATLAVLAPCPGERLWDVGAGSGSVAIEWLRAAPEARAIAIERDAERAHRARANAARLGTPELEIVLGEAPAALTGLAAPDAVFIGGGTSDRTVLEAAWSALGPGGRLVANAVTLEGAAALADHQGEHGGALTRIETAHAGPLGPGRRGFRPTRAVTQLASVKR